MKAWIEVFFEGIATFAYIISVYLFGYAIGGLLAVIVFLTPVALLAGLLFACAGGGA